jgi:hypothetical protein
MFFKRAKRKINFLVVGTQKAGTSALSNYLKHHPDIGLGKRKEIHFFDDEKAFIKSRVNYAAYERNFDFTSKKSIYGEVTPIYIYWEPSCRRIWEYNLEIKLIFILRSPVERAFSHWSMEFNRNAESESFSYCIRNEEERSKEALPHQHRLFSYVDRGFYSEQIRRYKRFFKDEQMLFVKYEQFKANQKEELFKIFDFLNVSTESFFFEHRNVNTVKKQTTMSMEDEKFLRDKFEYDIREVEKLLGWNCEDWLSAA